MHSEVFLQVAVLGEALPTLDANKGFLARVRALVHVQGALLNEALAAQRTAVRLLAGVRALVRVQVPLLGVPLPAQRAAEGFLPRVTALVDLQLAEAAEAFAALEAGEPLGRRAPQGVELHVSQHAQTLGGHGLRQDAAGRLAGGGVQRVALRFPGCLPPGLSRERRLSAQDDEAVREEGLVVLRRWFWTQSHVWTLVAAWQRFSFCQQTQKPVQTLRVWSMSSTRMMPLN